MLRVCLINMPFAGLDRPSIALTQLRSVVRQQFPGKVHVELLYLNMDFAHYLGDMLYGSVDNGIHHTTGLGDWFFRQAAFPDLPDNTEAYFKRCYPRRTSESTTLRLIMTEKRKGLDDYFDRLITKHELAHADIVGFTSVFSQNTASLAMARKLKQRNPGVTTVIGGANCEAPMGAEIVRQIQAVDFVFSGSALRSFPAFLQCCIANDFDGCHQIDGVFSKQNCGANSPPRVGNHGLELPIDAVVPLDYDDFFKKHKTDVPRGAPVVLFETSRGCWWGEKAHCTFCGLNGDSMAYRAMSPLNAITHMQKMFEYSDRSSYFECVDNIMPKQYVKDVLPFIKTPPDATIFYEVKADLHENELEILAKAGVRVIQPGIESISTHTLRLMKKGTTAIQNIGFLKNCIVHGILPRWNLLIGFPGETEDTFRKYVEDIPLLTHLVPPGGVFPVRFDRYSPYHVRADEYGLKLQPLDYYTLTYPFPPESLQQFAYYFANQDFKAEYSQIMMRWMFKVIEPFNKWSALWSRDDKKASHYVNVPQLYFDGKDAGTVVDSRSGTMQKYDIGESGRTVLECLAKPKTIATLQKDLSHMSALDPSAELGHLRKHGLLFQEGDHYLSLVHSQKPTARIPKGGA